MTSNKIKIGIWNEGVRQQEWLQEISESEFSQLDLESKLNMSLMSGSKSFQFVNREKSMGHLGNRSAQCIQSNPDINNSLSSFNNNSKSDFYTAKGSDSKSFMSLKSKRFGRDSK